MAGITGLLDQQSARPRLTHDEDMAERFQKKGPKEFTGTTDPFIAEGWIRSLDSIFAYMGITDADKVKYAVYMMRRDAALWWEGAVRGVHLPTLTWTEFRRIFFAKYFTEDVRRRMIREFMSLRQGYKFLVDAPKKLRHFIDGLRADIKHDIHMMDVTTYEATVSRALRSEKGRREMQREQQSKRQFQPGFQRASSQPPVKKQYMGPSKGPSQCLIGSNVCYHCKEPGHVAYNCPRKKNTTGRVFIMEAEEADPDTSLITWRILVGENSTFALLDSGATHSFISLEFIRRIGITPEVSVTGYDVTMPFGQILTTTSIVRGLEIELQGHSIRADLVVLPLSGFDLNFGMDWLAVNGALIAFHRRTVSVKPAEGNPFIFYASQSSSVSHVISYVCARNLMRCGCQCSHRIRII
ncbi:uncharacterized protein [Henckelia pumila]|uniref:uncharacterized protein n=1 Tax=Henckelia pumila TaxID=405737 RepID=UPI003C6E5CEF